MRADFVGKEFIKSQQKKIFHVLFRLTSCSVWVWRNFGRLKAGTIWRLTHSRILHLMLELEISVSLHMGWVFSPYGLVLASSQRGGWVSKVSILTMRERQPSGCCVVYNDRASAAPPREASAHAVGQGNYQGVPWSKGREHRPSSQWRSVNVPWKEEHVGWEIYRCSHLWKMASSSIVSCDSSVVPGLFMEKFMLFPIIWNATSCINQGWEVLFGGVAVYSVDLFIHP